MQIFNKDQLRQCVDTSLTGEQAVMMWKAARSFDGAWAYLFDQDKVRLRQTAVFAGVKDLTILLEDRPGQYMLIPEECVEALLHQRVIPQTL